MILNTYALLLGSTGLIRLLLGVVVGTYAVAAWLSHRKGDGVAERDRLEQRCNLLLMMAVLLLALNVVSWPLLYMLLQSYVPHWPGIMCIYGVTRIGEESFGASRHLPDLLIVLQIAKPLLVFASGAWFALYLLNRRTRSGPLLPRLFLMLVPLGGLAALDAAVELAYVGIPKQEEMPATGCCTSNIQVGREHSLTEALGPDEVRNWSALFYCTNGLVVALLLLSTRCIRTRLGMRTALLLLVGGLAALAATGWFLLEVAVPRLLGQAHHHCLYDLIPRVPEAVVAIALYLAAFFVLGWAIVLQWLGRGEETVSLLPIHLRQLLNLSLAAYLGSLTMLSLELAVA